MKGLTDWIVKRFLLKYLKGALDKLPANGKKTIISALVAVIGAVLVQFPEANISGILSELLAYMRAMGIDQAIMQTGIFAAGMSVFHKILKWLDNLISGDK